VVRDWLLPHALRASGEYELFKQVLKIRTIVQESARWEASWVVKPGPIEIVHAEYFRPKELCLEFGESPYYLLVPSGISTPWGRVGLGVSEKEIIKLHYIRREKVIRAISTAVLGRLSTTFHEMRGQLREGHYCVLPMATWLKPEYEKIGWVNDIMQRDWSIKTLAERPLEPGEAIVHNSSIDDVRPLRQTMVYAVLARSAPSFFIHAIDGEPIRQPQLEIAHDAFRDSPFYQFTPRYWRIKRNLSCSGEVAWRILSEMYQQEQEAQAPKGRFAE